MTVEEHQSDPPVQLNYGVAPSPWRRRTRRTLVILILGGLIIAGWRWGPSMLHQATVLYWQRQCMNYSAPPEMVVYEEDAKLAQMLLSKSDYAPAQLKLAGSSERQSIDGKRFSGTPPSSQPAPTIAAYQPRALDPFIRAGGLPVYRAVMTPSSANSYIGPPFHPARNATAFLGVVASHTGLRRLVIVECFPTEDLRGMTYMEFYVAGITPGTLFKPPQVSQQASMNSVVGMGKENIRVYAGQIDPADRSHFSIRYSASGKIDTIHGRMDDNGYVKLGIR